MRDDLLQRLESGVGSRQLAATANCPLKTANSGNRLTTHAFRRGSLVTISLVMACAGCAGSYVVSEGNFQTYEHPFTDAAAADVRRSAEKHCAEKKQVAVRTSSTCSLTQCTTSYQCMGKADAAKYQK